MEGLLEVIEEGFECALLPPPAPILTALEAIMEEPVLRTATVAFKGGQSLQPKFTK